jgi:hypothetical protein
MIKYMNFIETIEDFLDQHKFAGYFQLKKLPLLRMTQILFTFFLMVLVVVAPYALRWFCHSGIFSNYDKSGYCYGYSCLFLLFNNMSLALVNLVNSE